VSGGTAVAGSQRPTKLRKGVSASPARRVAEEALTRLSERVLVVESAGPRLDDALRAIHAAGTVAVDCEGVRLSREGQLTVIQVASANCLRPRLGAGGGTVMPMRMPTSGGSDCGLRKSVRAAVWPACRWLPPSLSSVGARVAGGYQ
jgi:hypothetical protein